MRGDVLSIMTPDNGHAHFRQGSDIPAFMVNHLIASGWRGRVVAEPNTTPPKLTGKDAAKYAADLTGLGRYVLGGTEFEAVPVMQITENTSARMVGDAFACNVKVFKVYPFFVTTNSENGVRDYRNIYPALAEVEKLGGIVQFHGEDPDIDVEGLSKEGSFLENILDPIRKNFPGLKISLEHITTKLAVDWVLAQAKNTVASITIHHLMTTIDDVLGYSRRSGGLMCVHEGCKPQPKFIADRTAIRKAAMSGDEHFLYGGDDAPHLRKAKKEALRSSCGVWNTVAALPLLAETFEWEGALPMLEPFVSRHWAEFYEYPYNQGTMELVRERWKVPEEYPVEGTNDTVVPFWFGQELEWSVVPPK